MIIALYCIYFLILLTPSILILNTKSNNIEKIFRFKIVSIVLTGFLCFFNEPSFILSLSSSRLFFIPSKYLLIFNQNVFAILFPFLIVNYLFCLENFKKTEMIKNNIFLEVITLLVCSSFLPSVSLFFIFVIYGVYSHKNKSYLISLTLFLCYYLLYFPDQNYYRFVPYVFGGLLFIPLLAKFVNMYAQFLTGLLIVLVFRFALPYIDDLSSLLIILFAALGICVSSVKVFLSDDDKSSNMLNMVLYLSLLIILGREVALGGVLYVSSALLLFAKVSAFSMKKSTKYIYILLGLCFVGIPLSPLFIVETIYFDYLTFSFSINPYLTMFLGFSYLLFVIMNLIGIKSNFEIRKKKEEIVDEFSFNEFSMIFFIITFNLVLLPSSMGGEFLSII